MSYITRQEFSEAFLAIYKDLHALSKRVRDSKKTENATNGGSISTITKINPVSSIETRTPKSEQRDDKRYKCWNLFVQSCTAAIVAIYTTVAAFQWCAMNKANTLARKAIEAQTRPWLGIDGPLQDVKPDGDGNIGEFSMSLRNYGKSPAIVSGQPRFIMAGYSSPHGDELDYYKVCDKADAILAQQGGGKYLLTVFPDESGTPQSERVRIDRIPGTNEYFAKEHILMGCIAYNGPDGGLYHTRVIYQVAIETKANHTPTGTSISVRETSIIQPPAYIDFQDKK